MVKLVIVVDVDTDPTTDDPHDVAQALLHEGAEWDDYGARFVRAEWEDAARREGADALVDDEDE